MYLDEADKKKKQYMIELAEYHKSDAYKRFVERREKALQGNKIHITLLYCLVFMQMLSVVARWFEDTEKDWE